MSLEMICPVCNTHFLAQFSAPAKPEVHRITDARNTLDASRGDGSKLSFIGPEYASVCPWSCDGSWLLLVHQSYFGLYDGSGVYVRDLPFEINASSRPRWSRTDPNRLYFQGGNAIFYYYASTKVAGVLKAFTEYVSIDSMGEADISEDGDHLPLCGTRPDGGREVFLFSFSKGKGRTLPVDRFFDSLQVTPDNHVSITWNESGIGDAQGVELYDQDMLFLRQLTHAGGHMCFARDADGSEVLLWTNSNDPDAPVPQQSIVKVKVSNGNQTVMLGIDWATLAIDIGANAGWFCLSVYGGPASKGKPYAGEILMVNISSGEIIKVCEHGSSAKDYTSQPKAAVSRDGKTIVFCSDQGVSDPNYCDTFMVKL